MQIAADTMFLALKRHEFVPHYQLIVALSTGALRGFECLARWQHPQLGLLSPAFFIPEAERTGTVEGVLHAILAQACHDVRAWPAHLTLAVNLSPLQLADPLMPARLLQLLDRHDFAPDRLVVELTETSRVEDFPLATRSLSELRAAGIRLKIDDFGTGYASFLRLHRLPFDGVKVDRSLMEMVDTSAGRVMLRSIFDLSHSLGMVTTMEGIESQEHAVVLQLLGCDLGQGFLYGSPQPASEVMQRLDSGVLRVAAG